MFNCEENKKCLKMDQDATQVRILRPPSRDENNVRPKLTDHGTFSVF